MKFVNLSYHTGVTFFSFVKYIKLFLDMVLHLRYITHQKKNVIFQETQEHNKYQNKDTSII